MKPFKLLCIEFFCFVLFFCVFIKMLQLCFAVKLQKSFVVYETSHNFPYTWGWDKDWVFIFWWTWPLISSPHCPVECLKVHICMFNMYVHFDSHSSAAVSSCCQIFKSYLESFQTTASELMPDMSRCFEINRNKHKLLEKKWGLHGELVWNRSKQAKMEGRWNIKLLHAY